MIESGKPSLLDIVIFDPEIKTIESFTYPVGAVCLLQRGEETCVFNIDSFYGYLNTVSSPFLDPKETIIPYSRLFLERLRNGNLKAINFESIPHVIIGITPDFVQVREGYELNKIN